jgi:hypothetical protein
MNPQEITSSESLNKNIDQVIHTHDSKIQEQVDLLTHELIDQASGENRLALLKDSLQTAINLEFGTIPIYLAALWSIKDNLDPVSKSIRNVVQEEMLHLALVCNLKSAIGGDPILYDTTDKGLRYPTKLPGGVHPELTLKLSGLTDDILDDFLEIELPQGEVMVAPYDSKYKDAHDHDSHPTTIGALYDAINEEFHSLKPPMAPDQQISGPLAWFVVDNLEKLDSAINWIKEQGEGAVEVTENKANLGELSHFYRFWEVRKRKKIQIDPLTGKFCFMEELKFPDVWPMAIVPEGGYQKDEVSEEVWELTHQFDLVYSKMIHTLESAWGEGGQAALWKAIEMMFDLEKFAIPLMKIPIPGQAGNYGPSFRLIEY